MDTLLLLAKKLRTDDTDAQGNIIADAVALSYLPPPKPDAPHRFRTRI